MSNREVSSVTLRGHMQHARFVALSDIPGVTNNGRKEVDGNWITIAVLAKKHVPKRSSKSSNKCGMGKGGR